MNRPVELVVVDVDTLRRIIAEEVERALSDRPRSLRLLTTEEAAEVLGVCRRTVMNLVRNEGLPHRELGPRLIRFVERELLEWSSAHRRA